MRKSIKFFIFAVLVNLIVSCAVALVTPVDYVLDTYYQNVSSTFFSDKCEPAHVDVKTVAVAIGEVILVAVSVFLQIHCCILLFIHCDGGSSEEKDQQVIWYGRLFLLAIPVKILLAVTYIFTHMCFVVFFCIFSNSLLMFTLCVLWLCFYCCCRKRVRQTNPDLSRRLVDKEPDTTAEVETTHLIQSDQLDSDWVEPNRNVGGAV